MADPVPPNVVPHLPLAIADAEAALDPTPDKLVAVLLERLFSVLPCPDAAGLRVWREHARRFPPDVLAAAVSEIIDTHVWETVPKIAQLVKAARPEMQARSDWLRQLRSAQRRLELGPPDLASSSSSAPIAQRVLDLARRVKGCLSTEESAEREMVRRRSLARARHGEVR